MFKFIARWFSPEPGLKIRKLRDKKYKEAVQLQRNGDLRGYANIVKEIKDLEDEYVKVINESR